MSNLSARDCSRIIAIPLYPQSAFSTTSAMPCAASVSATYGEIHSAKWTAILAVFYIGMSLLLGCIVYHVSSLFL